MDLADLPAALALYNLVVAIEERDALHFSDAGDLGYDSTDCVLCDADITIGGKPTRHRDGCPYIAARYALARYLFP